VIFSGDVLESGRRVTSRKSCGNGSHIRWLTDVEMYFPEFEPFSGQRVFGLQLFPASTEKENMALGLYFDDLRTSFRRR